MFAESRRLMQVLPVVVNVNDIRRADEASSRSQQHSDRSNASLFGQQQFSWSLFFPTMNHSNYLNYRKFQSASEDIVLAIPAISLIYLPVLVTRTNLAGIEDYTNLWIAQCVINFLNFIVMGIHVTTLLAKYFRRNRNTWAVTIESAVKNIDLGPDLILPLSILTIGLQLLARLSEGQCSPDTSLWMSQVCNPVADTNSIPTDTVIFLYLIPSIVSTYSREYSFPNLMLCHLLSLVFVAIALSMVSGWRWNAHTFWYGFFFLMMSYEREKSLRKFFLLALDGKAKSVQLRDVAALMEKNRAQAEISHLTHVINNVVHDLKTPLGCATTECGEMKSIINEGDFMGPEKIGRLSRLMEGIEASLAFLLMSINRSLDYIKVSSSLTLVAKISSFNLSEAIGTACKLVETGAVDRILTVHPIPSDICHYIKTDYQWLLENIICLLSNAVKYSSRGATVELRVKKFYSSVSARAGIDCKSPCDDRSPIFGGDAVIYVEVEDSGIGISDEQKQKLFQAFQSAQRMAGGTGIGLFSLASRAQAIGGKFGVHDRADGKEGSVFWFEFPYKPDEAAEQESRRGSYSFETGSLKSSLPAHMPSTRRILFIDDTPMVLKIALRSFSKAGFAVVTAENGYEAMEILKKNLQGQIDDPQDVKAFDVVVTDFQMPILDGFEFVRRFREFESRLIASSTSRGGSSTSALSRLFIIGSSANENEQLTELAREVGMDAVQPKPCTPESVNRLLFLHTKISYFPHAEGWDYVI